MSLEHAIRQYELLSPEQAQLACLPTNFDASLERHDIAPHFYTDIIQAASDGDPEAYYGLATEMAEEVTQAETFTLPWRDGITYVVPIDNPFTQTGLDELNAPKPHHDFLKRYIERMQRKFEGEEVYENVVEAVGETASLYVVTDNLISAGYKLMPLYDVPDTDRPHINAFNRDRGGLYSVYDTARQNKKGNEPPRRYGKFTLRGLCGITDRDIDAPLALADSRSLRSDGLYHHAFLLFPPEK